VTEREQYEDYLARLVAMPTVSADPAHRRDIEKGAQLAAELLGEAGFEAELMPTSGNPVVLGRLVQSPEYPTVLLYNHLDVVAADAAGWSTEPFKLRIEGDQYFGRGTTDDKGPALAVLMAVRRAVREKLPLNFIVVWESEEEIGSSHFEEFVNSHKQELGCDSVLVSDTDWFSPDRPLIPYGLRGVLGFEVLIQTGRRDAHSGAAGGAARNPLAEIAQVVTDCLDAKTGHVKIPGFYDDVIPASESEIENFMKSGFDVANFKQANELIALRTDDLREVLTRIMSEPTLEVHGITGGYQGPGIKTAIPPSATAKFTARLVPGQDPRKIFVQAAKFIEGLHPDAQISREAQAKPYISDPKGPYATAGAEAMKEVFGAAPAFVREGGSIGAVLTMSEHLGVPICMLGLSLPDHSYHGPNEHFDWRQAGKGIDMFVGYFKRISKLGLDSERMRKA
jgi:acetylornithine deacetylase/succinyl-diaminopimelate desuccinylase-like protein